MSNLVEDFWNYIPEEILANIFSFLPVRDRHTVLFVCKKWASTVSTVAVWSFTEISCDFEYEMEDKSYKADMIKPYLAHIRHLKIILDQTLELNRRLVTKILDTLPWRSSKLQALSIQCQGKSPYFYSGQDVLQSVRRLFQSMHKISLQYVDFRKMPFTLDNRTVGLIASSSPNLHTLLINNQALGLIILKPETIVEVLRVCPKLSVLGVYYASLSRELFLELLKPNREPFKRLDIFYEGLDTHISEELWAMVSKRHPQLKVELEFAPTVPATKFLQVLKASMPVTSLHFNSFTHVVEQLRLVTSTYSQSLEKLILYTAPSEALNSSLIDLARKCSRLREVHCHCGVSQAVVDAFLQHCPSLQNHTLPTGVFSSILESILQTMCP